MFAIKFQGNDYLLCGEIGAGGPIATREQYEQGQVSFAHLQRNGRVMRFGEQIGSRADIEVLGPAEAEMKVGGMTMMMNFLSGLERRRQPEEAAP